MENDKFVSIALTTYNGEKYLREQLDSIFKQTYKNLEVVVTDDCSSDGTLEILEEYSQNHNLRYFVNEKNLGFTKNFEKAISLCKGDYIALCDQDDIWLPEKIEILVNSINQYSLICSDAKLIDSQGEIISNSFKENSNIDVVASKPFEFMLFKFFVTGCTALFKRELVEKAVPMPENIGCHDFWLALVARKMNGIKYIKKPLILYRQHGNNQIGAMESHSVLGNLAKFIFDKKYKNKRKQDRQEQKRILTAVLSSNLDLSNREIKLIKDLIFYYDCLLGKKLNFRVIALKFKYKNLLFKKKINLLTGIFSYFCEICENRFNSQPEQMINE